MNIKVCVETNFRGMTYENVTLLLEQLRDRRYVVVLKGDKWCIFKNDEDRFRDQAIARKDSFLAAVMSSVAH